MSQIEYDLTMSIFRPTFGSQIKLVPTIPNIRPRFGSQIRYVQTISTFRPRFGSQIRYVPTISIFRPRFGSQIEHVPTISNICPRFGSQIEHVPTISIFRFKQALCPRPLSPLVPLLGFQRFFLHCTLLYLGNILLLPCYPIVIGLNISTPNLYIHYCPPVLSHF